MTPETLVKLDRKVSRALCTGKGIKLTGDELSILAELGMIEQLSDSKAKALKEQGRCRQLRVVSTNAGRSGSTSSVEPMASQRPTAGTSGGTTPPQDDSSGEARALRMFG
ncbi:hypothetical protein [Novosphingobium sp.]|uniref:hypothetical protein n=1 Tax=Novosphingobium sp. TaxID=1874826 RepID=UPI0038BA94A8